MAKDKEKDQEAVQAPKSEPKAVPTVSKSNFINKKLTVLNSKSGAKYENLASRVVTINK